MGFYFLFIFSFELFANESISNNDTIYFFHSISKNKLSNVNFHSLNDSEAEITTTNYLLKSNFIHYSFPISLSKENFHNKIINKDDDFSIIYLKPIALLINEVNVSKPLVENLYSPIRPYTITEGSLKSHMSTTSLLKLLPSISIKSYGGRAGVSTISVHGGQSQRFMVLFDNVPINNEQTGVTDISQIPPFLLSSIQYLPQGLSSRLGKSALTGALNFTPSKIGTKINIRLGNHNDSSIAFMLSKTILSSDFIISAGQSKYDAIYDYKETGNYSLVPYQVNEIFKDLKNSINQIFLYSKINRDFKNKSFMVSFFKVQNDRELSTNIYSSSLNNQEMFDDLQVISMSTKFNKYKFSANIKETSIEYLSDLHRLLTYSSSVNYIKDNFNIKVLTESVINRSTKTIDTTKNFYLFSLEKRTDISKIEMHNSIKFEFDKKSKTVYSYDIIFKVSPLNNISSSITYSRNYKKPNFNDLLWEPFGNAYLKNEFSNNFYIKNILLTNYGQLDINFHYIDFHDLISWRPMVGTNAYWIPDNISSAKSFGGDIYVRSNEIKGFTSSFSASYLKTENYDDSINEQHSGKMLIYTPKFSAFIKIIKKYKSQTFYLTSKFVGERIYRYNWPHDNILPSYFFGSLAYERHIFNVNKFKIFSLVNCENIFDNKYQSVHGFPVPGRTYSISITIKEK